MVPFIIITFISVLLAIGLYSKIPKKWLFFSSKLGNIIYIFVMYFISIGYCYLLFPIFLNKLSDQFILKTRKGEIVDVYNVWDESSENYTQKVIAKTIVVSEVTQEIDQSIFTTYTVGDSIQLVYNEEKDKLIESSVSSKLTSSLFLLSCAIVFFVIGWSLLLISGFLSYKS